MILAEAVIASLAALYISTGVLEVGVTLINSGLQLKAGKVLLNAMNAALPVSIFLMASSIMSIGAGAFMQNGSYLLAAISQGTGLFILCFYVLHRSFRGGPGALKYQGASRNHTLFSL